MNMETRKITIISTRNQSKNVIMSAAATLGELKTDLRQANIDYQNMTFYEGLSKTELKDDRAILPHNIPYKGQITNELVFMLTTTNKKIRSGANMSRAEIYNLIKAQGLKDECMKRFGKNFTMCKTVDLIALIMENAKSAPKTVTTKKKNKTPMKKQETTSVKTDSNCGNTLECIDAGARKALLKLLYILEDDGYIDEDELLEIKGILDYKIPAPVCLEECKPVSSYSDEEIDNMFNFVI